MPELKGLSYDDVLRKPGWKRGYIKCRLIHMDGRSVVQPDILLSSKLDGKFYIPRFFDANQIGFLESTDDSFCRLTIVIGHKTCLMVGFFKRDHVITFADGSLIYKCAFVVVDGDSRLQEDGRWRQREAYKFQLRSFHHTDEKGFRGITVSKEIWGSRRNIQGNLWLENIAYGYFTDIPYIRSEEDLLKIAMSSSGLTGLIPTNAPYHPRYANLVAVPQQDAAQRSRSMAFWIDVDLIAPNHNWLHRPMTEPAYYEVVLPNVFRVGVLIESTLSISNQQIVVPEEYRKLLKYVIVGDADTREGLQAPYHEEETTQVAAIEQLDGDSEIIDFWRENSNTDQFRLRDFEYSRLREEED